MSKQKNYASFRDLHSWLIWAEILQSPHIVCILYLYTLFVTHYLEQLCV